MNQNVARKHPQKIKILLTDFSPDQFNYMEIKYFTIREASEFLKLSTATLRNWDKRGVLAAYRHPVNNYRVYRQDQLQLFARKLENSKNKNKQGRRIDISLV